MWMIHPDHPIGSSDWRMAPFPSLGYSRNMWLEVGIVVLSALCFYLLDLYVLGCEKV